MKNTLDDIAKLKNDWNENSAPAFSEALIQRCRSICETLISEPSIFPTANDSIQLEWDGPDETYLEIELFENGRCSLSELNASGQWSSVNLTDIEATQKANRILIMWRKI